MQRFWMSILLAMTMPLFAVEVKTLPDFPVKPMQGESLSIRQLSSKSHWVLVVLAPHDPLSDRLLKAFQSWPSEQWIARTVFVVGGSAEDAQTLMTTGLGDLAGQSRWVVDTPKGAWKALGLHGQPVLLGLDDSQISWSVAGVLPNPSSLEAIVRSWVKG